MVGFVELPWGGTGPPATGAYEKEGLRLRDVKWAELGGKLRTIPLIVDEAGWYGDLTAGLGGAAPAGTAGSGRSGLLTTA